MFWHGRSYGHKALFFILIYFYRAWGRVATTLFLNGANGMPAVADLFGLYHALFAVCLCAYLVVWWNTDSKDED